MRYEEPAYKKYLAKPNRVSGKKRIKLKNKEIEEWLSIEELEEKLRSRLPNYPRKRIVMRDWKAVVEMF